MSPTLPDVEVITRLLMAAGIGAVLGLEREWRMKTAGLRTNILIAVGSAIFTMMSRDLVAGLPGADPSRIAAQIVTGIGFLGAGAILRTDSGVHGLTTAATVWVNAALGIAVGGGEYRLAIIGAIVTIVALLVLHPIESAMERRLRAPHERPARDSATDV
jgi:putative Mg2+ transporter-C (MgtC) family protein